MNHSLRRLLFFIILGCFLLAAGLAGIWLWQHVERVTEIKEVGYRGEARYNPLLAATRLLQKMQMEVKVVHHLPNIEHSLKHTDVLFFVQNYRPLSDEEAAAVLNWVAQGGHVLVISNTFTSAVSDPASQDTSDAEESDEEADQILDTLQVQQVSLELDDQAILNAPPVLVELPGNAGAYQVHFNPNYVLRAQQEPAPLSEHLLHLAHEKGHVTVLSDAWFLHNARIGEQDHAPFFWALLNLQQRPQRVWMVYPLNRKLFEDQGIRRKPAYLDEAAPGNTPSLPELLWEHAWFLLLSLLVLLLFFLWRASRRFGGLLPPPTEQRRRLLEHIEASGQFLWQAGQANQLLRGLRQNLFKELQRQHPAWLHLPRAELSQRLGEHCGIAAERVQTALYHVQFTSAAAFTDAAQCLKHLRRAL